MATLKITDENFDTEVLKSSKPIVVDFWAEWCAVSYTHLTLPTKA